MELEFPRLKFHMFFFFLGPCQTSPKRKSSLDGFELEFIKLEFQKQSNLLICFICMLCTKIFFFLKSYYLANFALWVVCNAVNSA